MNRLFTCPKNLVYSILYKIIPVPETVPLYYRDPASSHWTIIMHKSSSHQLNKLYDPHFRKELWKDPCINPLNPELNPICCLLALLGAHHFLHVSRIRVKLLTFRLLMSYIYMEPPFLMFLDHTQRSTVGRTPLDE